MAGRWRRPAQATVAALSALVIALVTDPVAWEVSPARADEATRTRLYTASSAVLSNPGRGFYHYTETHDLPDGSGWQPLDATQLVRWRTREQVTVVYRVVYLERYVDTDVLDPQLLQRLAADFAAVRRAGLSVVLRFAYSADTDLDAPPARVVRHIAQLAPVINRAADIVLALQAGFIGRWGEWYYSTSFTTDPSQPWNLTDSDWDRRGQVLGALLDRISRTVPLQVRYPAIVQRLLPPGTAGRDRVGIHDDCFLADDTDMGTYAQPADRAWLQTYSAATFTGGESCALDGTHSQWPEAAVELGQYHWSVLNADYDPQVLSSWGTAGTDVAARRLGYRLRLVSVTAPITASPAAPVTLTVQAVNDGWAAPVRHRRAVVVFASGTDGADRVGAVTAVDVASTQPGPVTWRLTVPAPAAAGSYDLRLAFPDPNPVLAPRPAYALQLANVGTWDPNYGDNDLGIELTVA